MTKKGKQEQKKSDLKIYYKGLSNQICLKQDSKEDLDMVWPN